MSHCNVIKDMLPLYVEDVCSKETKEIVEEHIESCESCRALLNEMKAELLPKAVVNKQELKTVKAPLKKLRYRAAITDITWFLIALILVSTVAYFKGRDKSYKIPVAENIKSINFSTLTEDLKSAVRPDDDNLYPISHFTIDVNKSGDISKFYLDFAVINKGKPVHYQTNIIKNKSAKLSIIESWEVELSEERRQNPRDLGETLKLIDRIPWDHLSNNLITKSYDYLTITNRATGDGQGNIRIDGGDRAFVIDTSGNITELQGVSVMPQADYNVLSFAPMRYTGEFSASGSLEVQYFFQRY
jgi:hypothetical protein